MAPGAMTKQIKDHPFKVVISAYIRGAVQANQVKSLTWRKRWAGREMGNNIADEMV